MLKMMILFILITFLLDNVLLYKKKLVVDHCCEFCEKGFDKRKIWLINLPLKGNNLYVFWFRKMGNSLENLTLKVKMDIKSEIIEIKQFRWM